MNRDAVGSQWALLVGIAYNGLIGSNGSTSNSNQSEYIPLDETHKDVATFKQLLIGRFRASLMVI